MKKLFCYLSMALFILLGSGFSMLRGYSFSACVCFGIALLIFLYRLLHLLSRRHEKCARILRCILSIALCAGLLAAAVTGGFVINGSFGSPETSCRYLIVLGAGVHGTTPSLSLRERLNAAADYLQANPRTVCIVSGGQGPGEDITEAACMADYLAQKGIEPERIWQEDKSTSTEENIAFSLDLIEARTGSRPDTAGVLSSEYHLFRAGLIARDQGLTAVGIPARTTWLSLRLNYFMREIAAVWYHLLTRLI